ncbi:hypothetical protein [Pseudomonas frederiksbergensis]|uniref:hypothetical protein n=1 Tax=Pseudomonas frederiksbergensis TaxID=104087 RepID=UPI003D2249E1
MKRREEFLEKALEIHRDYEEATDELRAMIRKGDAAGPNWDAAVARQIHALKVWSELPQEFAEFQLGGGVDGGG